MHFNVSTVFTPTQFFPSTVSKMSGKGAAAGDVSAAVAYLGSDEHTRPDLVQGWQCRSAAVNNPLQSGWMRGRLIPRSFLTALLSQRSAPSGRRRHSSLRKR